ncbi:MAG: molybdenum cofactor biosynthesis protein MoaE [Spirochaetes bacterium]|nr:molybdenum cofactor biosynthesis protein MoaE [Spirochaetota bacterium]
MIQQEAIDVAKYSCQLGSDADGAVVTFTGRARNMSGDKAVEYLVYDIYNGMAINEMQRIVDEAMERWRLGSCLVVHRYGKLAIGETSVFIGVSSPHREESFASSRYIIDEIKHRAPIWKKEYYSDGSRWIEGQR